MPLWWRKRRRRPRERRKSPRRQQRHRRRRKSPQPRRRRRQRSPQRKMRRERLTRRLQLQQQPQKKDLPYLSKLDKQPRRLQQQQPQHLQHQRQHERRDSSGAQVAPAWNTRAEPTEGIAAWSASLVRSASAVASSRPRSSIRSRGDMATAACQCMPRRRRLLHRSWCHWYHTL